MEEGVSKRGRGRPKASDPTTISDVAFELFRANGYGRTTMTDIAEAVGISAPTLFRYFPSKPSILWNTYADNVERFRELLLLSDPGLSAVDAVFDAYRAMLAEQRSRLHLIKSRVALVAGEPNEVAATWENYGEWIESVSLFIARRSPNPDASPEDLEARVLGGMIWSGLWGAIVFWALSDEDTPDAILARARALIQL
ncbi:hypothetical protein GCM10027416_29460 [Okibacterium endophyticum]